MSSIERAFCRSVPWTWFARRNVLPWALQHRQLSGRVLEIGAGSGAMAAAVARSHPDADLTATDIDPVMVAAATARLGDTATAQRADVTNLPFEDGSFDGVVSWLMLHHVIDWRPAISEVVRVLRPGGEFTGYDLTDTRLARLVHRADRSPFRLVSAADLRRELETVRLIDIEVSPAFWGHLMRFSARKSG